MDIINKINAIIENIFDYNINKSIEETLMVIEEIIKNMEKLMNIDNNRFNEIMNNVNISLQNKDYLFLADILKYELIPSLKNEV